ncbi:MAG: hypothetical protein JEZ03_13620 [Bacteroidales bacterium]|nr:hypothetical protein [Bacteroidales bacterium]
MDGKMRIIFRENYQGLENKLLIFFWLMIIVATPGCLFDTQSTYRDEYNYFYEYYEVGNLHLFPTSDESIVRTSAILHPSLLDVKMAGFIVFKKQVNNTLINGQKDKVFSVCDDSLNTKFQKELNIYQQLPSTRITFCSDVLKEFIEEEFATLEDFKQLAEIPCSLNYSLKGIQKDTIKIETVDKNLAINVFRISGWFYDQTNKLNIYWLLIIENKENDSIN